MVNVCRRNSLSPTRSTVKDPSTHHKILEDDECFKIIRKKLKQDAMDDFSLITYEVVPINQVLGYYGQYYTLKATVACPEAPLDIQHINFFTKILPPITSPQYEFIREYGTFKKEVALYTTVFPEVLDGLNQRCIPECFLGLDDQVIVLEHMGHSGYKMTNKFVPFDFEHCKVLMKSLAAFHARSLIFEEQYKKNLHDEFSHCIYETLWPLKEGKAKSMFDAAVKGIISMIDLVTNLSEKEKQTFKNKVTTLSIDHANKLEPSSKYKNVLCHGDLWANNVLYKYDTDNKPIDCCLIDFQLARYNPPAHDILCFLQFTTTRDLRRDHSKELFKIYYDTMSQTMVEAGIDIENVFPWKEFMNSLEDLRLVCMTHGVLNMPIMLLESNAANKYFSENPELLESMLYDDRTPLICEQFKKVPEYRERMLDVLLELYDYVEAY